MARTGALTLKKLFEDGREVFLHSSGDPVREARSFVQANVNGSPSELLLVGFGLGYHVRELLLRMPEGSTCTVAVLNPDAFWHAMEWIPLQDILSSRTLRLIWGTDAQILEQVFQHPLFNDDPSRILIHRPSLAFAGEGAAYLQEYVDQVEAHNAFWSTHGVLIRKNLQENLETALRTPGVIHLFSLFRGRPCFIVAPGPSLDDEVARLAEARERGVVLAVGSALPVLARAGIRPHLVIAIDPLEQTAAFHKSSGRNIPLVFVPQISPAALTAHEGPKFVGLSGNETHGLYSNTLLLSKGVIDGQGSVSVFALDLAIRMECDPIVFVGMDLSNPDRRIHAGGHPDQDRMGVSQDRLVFHPKVTKVDGQETFVLRNYHRFLRNLERRIEFHPGRKYINTSRIGVRIRSTEETGFEEVLASLPAVSSEEIDRTILDTHSAKKGDALRGISG